MHSKEQNKAASHPGWINRYPSMFVCYSLVFSPHLLLQYLNIVVFLLLLFGFGPTYFGVNPDGAPALTLGVLVVFH